MTGQPAPYGSWSSAISAEMAARGAIRYGDLKTWQNSVLWCEGRPEQGGRNVIVCKPAGSDPAIDLLPMDFSARSRVHEYGGGSFLVTDAGLFFVNTEDQDLYHLATLDGHAVPERLTDEPDLRFADGTYDPAHQCLIMVAERRSQPGHAGAVENLLVSISLKPESRGQVREIASGRDFYAAPRISPVDGSLAWLEWSLPHMPWENSELWVAPLDDQAVPVHPQHIAGGGGFMATEPRWSDDGALWFIADDSGWASLQRWRDNAITSLPLQGHEFGQPMWVLGGQSFSVGSSGDVSAMAQHEGQLKLLHHDGRKWSAISSPARQVESLVSTGEALLGVAATDLSAPAIVELTSGARLSHHITGPDKADISIARPLSFSSGNGATSYALYYPPRSSRHKGAPGARPPMIVSAHGGPTGMADRGLKLKIQYWTSRGFAWLDVDYRGSIGHGRDYRRALDGQWGLADVEDVAAAALTCVDQGLADARQLLISGSSAGGYTVLRALCDTDIFAAGASYYGIGDLAKLVALTHKFESGYLHGLLGLTGQNQNEILRERSPIFQAGRITSPVIFFQGSEDAVVPPGQSRDMAASLRARGTPVAYVEFEGEGHGFRRAGSIITALESEYAFYARILELQPQEPLRTVSIDNF